VLILSEIPKKNKINLKCGFAVMIFSLFVMTGFNVDVFAGEIKIQTPLSLGNNHQYNSN
jgi:hypothetical protein